MSELQTFQDRLAEWSDATFGYHRPPDASLKHLKEEVEELIKEPYDKMEYADALTLLVDSARRAGMSAADLLAAAYQKLEINKKRKWGKPNAEGYCKHVEEPVHEAAA